jgi:hypothetical protein
VFKPKEKLASTDPYEDENTALPSLANEYSLEAKSRMMEVYYNIEIYITSEVNSVLVQFLKLYLKSQLMGHWMMLTRDGYFSRSFYE